MYAATTSRGLTTWPTRKPALMESNDGYTRPLASTRGAQETASGADVRRVEGLAWVRPRDLDSGEVPLVSVAALFKA